MVSMPEMERPVSGPTRISTQVRDGGREREREGGGREREREREIYSANWSFLFMLEKCPDLYYLSTHSQCLKNGML